MTCLTREQIAAIASGQHAGRASAAASEDREPDRDLDHAESCLACRRQLAEQRAVRAFVARTAAPVLTRARRAQLAAEVMARADALPARRSRRSVAVVAAAAAIVVAAGDRIELTAVRPPEVAIAARPPAGPELAAPRTGGRSAAQRTPDPPDPRVIRAMVSGSRAQFSRGSTGGRDVVDLRDGEITVDARTTDPVEIGLGSIGVHVAAARVSVVARRGVIESVTVFAGSAQVTTGGQDHKVEAGTMWHRETLADPGHDPKDTQRKATVARPGPVGPPDPRQAIAAFRDGWEALRQERYADAVAAFDRASDPVVAEDAAYWAAIAAERGGDRDAAIRRLTSFLARFPDSSRTDTARAARDQLSHGSTGQR